MSLRVFSDQCVPAEITEHLRQDLHFYHGKLFIAEVHRIRVRT
jgi:hypothetical protein